ncbi:LexA family protein [Hymenobacter arizonensis]|uniref:SOS response UmuD protein. Serine peptidase. MEROPS family S24 n=1 Tax=Hymenobacter arizonensis TaxID=1227077 RepID=A0A1I5ZA28_HYMAR|nr:translesion error-prone DNA polymerase V autoproteolytic subunit [Hymenobacter arizonensis]SFQ53356.1 SOS response UmuD protein. Serine peptidase. MEROPS family S24 [Hymenobacter arizonensis]
MLTSLQDFISASHLITRELPLFGCAIPAGFPSPADDHLDAPLDLTKHLFRHPASTFLARVSGDSMIGAGIHPGDLVAVDRALRPDNGSIVVAVIEGEHTIKRLQERGGQRWLVAENARYPPVPVDRETGLLVWGVVTHVIHALGNHQVAKL